VKPRDLGVLGGLLAILGALAILITTQPPPLLGGGAVATLPSPGASSEGSPLPSSAVPTGSGSPTAGPIDSGGLPAVGPTVREGILGRPSSINPLTARNQADRDLVALVFSGLATLGQGNAVVPDLASSWTVQKNGARYVVRIRPDARWQDGIPVTAADVVFTIKLLQDPHYTGPQAASWNEISVTAVNDHTVRFDMTTPLGGFPNALRQPLLPQHLLKNVAVVDLADSAFSSAPVGSGPYRLIRWDVMGATLEPVAGSTAPAAASPAAPGAAATASPASGAAAADRPLRIEFSFFSTAQALTKAYTDGSVDEVSGLSATAAKDLAMTPETRLVRYPQATLTTIMLNLRPDHPAFRDQRLRRALLESIDRSKLLDAVISGLGSRADSLIPPRSWAFSSAASKELPYNTTRAARDLVAAGWRKVAGHWHRGSSKSAYQIELIVPDRTSNPSAYAAAQFVAKSWRSLGFRVKVVPLTPLTFVGDRLSQADFAAAVVDVNIGLDPDLFPLLASRQAGHGGSNFSGVQSLVLDARLNAARKPGTQTARKAAYADLQKFLSLTQVMLPLYFRDEPVVVSNRLSGESVRLLGDASDRFWDVLTWRLAAGG
jgi:peptide/nickel transport system substrate-binding protein